MNIFTAISRLPGRHTLCLMGLLLLAPLPALAQSQPQKAKTFTYNPPPLPKNQGAPTGRRQGGASRGTCEDDYTDLTALVPIQDGLVGGVTASLEPTLWFYIPAALSSETQVELVLQDSADQIVSRTLLAINTDSAGILPISVEPNLGRAIVGDRDYQWTLSIVCDPQRPSASPYVQGFLRLSDQDFSHHSRSAFDQAAEYAEAGVWFESLTLLAKLHQAEPNNGQVLAAWSDLLQQADLASISSAAFLDPGEAKQQSTQAAILGPENIGL
jgi:hypothetical protein